MTSSTDAYRRDLIVALRLRNVPPARVGEIVAEVESHVAETGEDPREAFGAPREYAESFRGPQTRREQVALLALALTSAAAGWLIGTSAFGLATGDRVAGLPAPAAMVLGAVLWIPAVVAMLRRAERVRDPRDGRPLSPAAAWTPALATGSFAVLAVGLWLLAEAVV
jgi:hypothetical protein